jgi:hypothetical protein
LEVTAEEWERRINTPPKPFAPLSENQGTDR